MDSLKRRIPSQVIEVTSITNEIVQDKETISIPIRRKRMNSIDFKKLKKDLLNEVGPSGIMPAIIEVDCASKDKLIKLAAQYGLDIEEYIEER